MNKLVLVLLDGLRADTARRKMGFLAHLAESGIAAYAEADSELPSLSRPLYETILTGLPPIGHGITANGISRRSKEESLFSTVRKAGGKTAAAAYSWVSELHAASPFDPARDRDRDDPDGNIQFGRFYWDDGYPDTHLFADAESLIRKAEPDFMLVHSMNIDDAGHKAGSASTEYAYRAAVADECLGIYLPRWRERGYSIIVTSDHGMSADRLHGGDNPEDRALPFVLWGPGAAAGFRDARVPQVQVAAIACRIMGVRPAPRMAPLGDEGKELFAAAE